MIGRPPNEPRSMARSFANSNRPKQAGAGLINIDGLSVAIPRTSPSGTLMAPRPNAYTPPGGNGDPFKDAPNIQTIGIRYPTPPGGYISTDGKDKAKP